jgi:hypothetical protein
LQVKVIPVDVVFVFAYSADYTVLPIWAFPSNNDELIWIDSLGHPPIQ